MYYLKKLHMVGFDIVELGRLYREAEINNFKDEILSQRISLDSLRFDDKKINEIVDNVVVRNSKNKEHIEVFVAIDTCITFYPEGSKILFVLKDTFDPKKNFIKSLNDLKNATKEGTLTDFAIMSSSGLRQFQLKQYREELETKKILNFIKKELQHYGNVLDDINLLILLQGEKDILELKMNIDFKEINQEISTLGLGFKGEILILYNEENKFNIINQVYPKLATCRKKFDNSDFSRKAFI